MCGRFCLCEMPASIGKKFRIIVRPDFVPRYNIAPTQNSLVILQEEQGSPKMQNLYWGLVPSWAKDKNIGVHSINARAETIDEKPSFREAFRQRRCLIPANGFYEWTKGSKTPFYFSGKNENCPVVFGGLWEDWYHQDEHIRSFTIITTEANDLMSPIHDRLPVIIPPDHWERWLDLSITARGQLDDLLRPISNDYLVRYEIEIYVNNVRHEGGQCIEPVINLL